jgi:DNA-binding Lrp family transcriptional regulator
VSPIASTSAIASAGVRPRSSMPVAWMMPPALTEIDLAALNRHVQAFLHVQVRPMSREVIEGFKTYVTGLPEVLAVFVVAGGDDFLVQVAVPSVEALHSFLMDRFTGRREIVGFRSSVIYQHVRKPVVEPLG